MSMKKYTSPEKLEVFHGEEAVVLNRHLKRTGKAVSEFSDEERESFLSDLETVREREAEKTREVDEK